MKKLKPLGLGLLMLGLTGLALKWFLPETPFILGPAILATATGTTLAILGYGIEKLNDPTCRK